MKTMLICLFTLTCLVGLILTSCSMNFQNISTHGTATDVVDDQAAADVKPNIQIPFKPGV